MTSISTGQPYQWARIHLTFENLDALSTLACDDRSLQSEGYATTQPTGKNLWPKMKCKNCHTRMKNYEPSPEFHQKLLKVLPSTGRCNFHSGTVKFERWTCCNRGKNAKPCCSHNYHEPCSLRDLQTMWTYITTDLSDKWLSIKLGCEAEVEYYRSSLSSAKPRPPNLSFCAAVVLDCEMGMSESNSPEVIRVTLLNLFRPDPPLIDSIVQPDCRMRDLSTRYSGVTWAHFNRAIREGRAIKGRDAARELICSYVGPNTYVIVHGGKGDFECLRWIHPSSKVIDTHILEGKTKECMKYQREQEQWQARKMQLLERGKMMLEPPPEKVGRSLQAVAERRCGVLVQQAKVVEGRKLTGHDSLEDTLATREVVAWWLGIL